MSEKSVKELMHELQAAVTSGLLKRINADEATGAEFSAAINLLKNNNINIDEKTDKTLDELQKKIDERKKRFKTNEADNVVTFRGASDG